MGAILEASRRDGRWRGRRGLVSAAAACALAGRFSRPRAASGPEFGACWGPGAPIACLTPTGWSSTFPPKGGRMVRA